jgi:hypothetical protein
VACCAENDPVCCRQPLRLAWRHASRPGPRNGAACDRPISRLGVFAGARRLPRGRAILLIAFVWRETRAPAPLVDLHLFRSRSFAAGTIGVLISYAMLFGMFFAMSYAFVRGYRDLPIIAGLRLTIVPIALGIVAPFAGAVPDRYSKLVLVSGPVICGLSALGLIPALSGASDSLPMIMVGLGVYGIGLGSISHRTTTRRWLRRRRRNRRPLAVSSICCAFSAGPWGSPRPHRACLAPPRTGRNASPHEPGAAAGAARGSRRGVGATRYFRGHRRGNGASALTQTDRAGCTDSDRSCSGGVASHGSSRGGNACVMVAR